MNLDKASEAERLRICRTYTIVSLFALPWLGLVNIVWFLRTALRTGANRLFRTCPSHAPPPARLRADALLMGTHRAADLLISFASMAFWVVVIAVWASIYQANRASWGATGDSISVVIPLGQP